MFYEVRVRYWSFNSWNDSISNLYFFGKENAFHFAELFKDGYNVRSVLVIDALTGEIIYDSKDNTIISE